MKFDKAGYWLLGGSTAEYPGQLAKLEMSHQCAVCGRDLDFEEVVLVDHRNEDIKICMTCVILICATELPDDQRKELDRPDH